VSCALPELRVAFLLPAHAHAFAQLYAERIDDADQVDPKSILQWMGNPSRCPASAEQLALARLDSEPTHLLLGAWSGEALVGFTHCTYLPAERLAFVPYLAVRPGAPGAPATLRFTVTDSLFFSKRQTPLMPDHGKLMHLFAVRERAAAGDADRADEMVTEATRAIERLVKA